MEQGPPESGRGAPKVLFGDLTLKAVEGGGAVPMRLISGRIPKKILGPLLHLDSRPGFRGCDREGACDERAIPGALLSRSGAASKHKALGTCSALRGTLCRSACQYRHIGCTSLRAITNSGSNARVFLGVMGS